MKTKPGPGNLELVDIPEPEARDSLVKIRVVYSGICGSDLHTWDGLYPGNKPPVVLGHEFSGYVSDIGENVKNCRVGDRVTSETTFSVCGECEFCRNEEYNLCSARQGLGTQADGSFAEYVLARSESVHRLPDTVSLLSAALTEPLACCVHGCLERGTVSPGDTVLVMGPGAMGQLSSMVLLSQGCSVILAGLSEDEDKLALARTLGVNRTVNLQKEDIGPVVRELTDGRGASPVIECSGSIKALNMALTLAAKKADIVQLGIFSSQYNEIDTSLFFSRELRLVGSRTQKPSSWRKALDLMARGSLAPERIVSKIVSLDNWKEGFTALREHKGVKFIIKSSRE
ncbi:MAG: zinc-binding dehydrogenase [Treponema sp.]|nr:zinc-binding dehydrogenase [Treponema sp.]